jgi:hypothetical protein
MQEPGLAYTNLLASNISAARAATRPKLSQADVGERMHALGFTAWRRQTMGNAERGTRRLTAWEILGLCAALECPPGALLLPVRSGSQDVSLPAGQLVHLGRDANVITLLTTLQPDGTPAPNAWDGNIPNFRTVERRND